MQLVLPSLEYKDQYLQALNEVEEETNDTHLDRPGMGQSFEEFVQLSNDHAKGVNLPEGYVPATTFWLIDNNEFIGRVQIRHALTEHLVKRGGHIGYYIRPSKRKMGYGKKILELALLEAKKLGLSKVLITCDDNNIGSQKIIEANGGILENVIDFVQDGPKTRRYWIDCQDKISHPGGV